MAAVAIVNTFSASLYNSLSFIADAQDCLEHSYFEEAYSDVKNLFIKEGVNNEFGVCLLHNHNTIAEAERMVERYRPTTGSLNTGIEVAPVDVYPSVWKVVFGPGMWILYVNRFTLMI
jgi:hypothetical protein